MTETKIDMEEECQRLQDNLKQLTEDRNLLREEFAELNAMYRDLIVQLREDTLAGEGQLHTFQSEKRRMEDRLEQLELQIQEKNEKMLELDSKASDYLLRVTTASNTLYDDDEQSEQQKETQRNLIQKLVYEDMMENDEVTANEDEDEVSGEADDEQTESGNSGDETESSETENVPSVKIRLNDEPIHKETVEAVKHKTGVKESQGSIPSVEPSSSTGEEMKSLSSLVEELKRVKDEMGRCISSKEESFTELEGQLQATKKELAILRGSMSDLSIELQKREEGYISSDRERSSDRISLSHDDKYNLMHKIGILESMVTEDRVDLEELLLEKRSESGSDSGEMSPCFLRSNLQSPSACSISGRVALLERELNEANEKLARSRRRMKVLSMEREHKQRECEMLQRKVDRVESKMCELQGTFDALVKALMIERDELVDEMKAKNFKIELLQSKISQMENSPSANQLADKSLYIGKEEHDTTVKAIEAKYNDQLAVCQNSLRELEVNHSKEIERLKSEINSSNDTHLLQINDFKALISQMEQEKKEKMETLNVTRSEAESERKLTNEMRASMEMHQARAQMLEKIIEDKTKENDEFKKKVNSLEAEKSDFAPRLQEEMDRIKEEASKANEDKNELIKTFKELQEEQKETLRLNSELAAKLEEFEKEKRESGSVKELKQQLEEQTQKLTTFNSLNDKLSSQLNNKEQVMKEEICAREATIQELGVTLRNNQKQSRENYQMLQDEMAALQLLQKKEKEENEALISHLKEKIIKSEEEAEKYLQELNELKQKKDGNGEEESKGETETSATLEDSNTEEVRTTPVTTPEEPEPKEMSEESFQKELKSKQDEVNLLEERVSSLERSLREKSTSVAELESKIRDVEMEESYKSRFEQQMDQIKKLNDFIDELKGKVDQLSSESSELQQTVDQLKSEKNCVEGEKESLVKELEDLKISSETLENDLEAKKNLVEDLNFKLSTIESSILDTPRDVDISLVDRLDALGTYIESSIKNIKIQGRNTKNEQFITSNGNNSTLEYGTDSDNDKAKIISDLRNTSEQLREEKAKLMEQFELERNQTVTMQNQMVSDMEGLILKLEREKKDLEAELEASKKDLAALSLDYDKLKESLALIERERNVLRQEIMFRGCTDEKTENDKLTLIDELGKKSEALEQSLRKAEQALEEKETDFQEQLSKERIAFEFRLGNLRRDLREEMDILEQQKDDLRQEMQWEVERVAAEWAMRLEASEREKTSQLLDEKAQFGRVLVGKNDAYEKLAEERLVEVAGYQARLSDLQLQLEEKNNMIEELETNMEEIVGVRDNLEDKVNLLKESLMMAKPEEGAAAGEDSVLAQFLNSIEVPASSSSPLPPQPHEG